MTEWISVKDRLPEATRIEDNYVIVCYYGPYDSVVKIGWYNPDEERWETTEGDYIADVTARVTYWLLLPDKPRRTKQ